jgi:hypothetical protein
MNRRNLLVSAGPLLVLAACSSTSTNPATSPQQILLDITGAVSTAKALVATVVATSPKAINTSTMTVITATENSLTAAVSSLSTANLFTAGLSTLQTIDADLNTVLSTIGAVIPVLSATFPAVAALAPGYDAAVAIVEDVLEPYINSLVPSTTASAKAPLHFIKGHPAVPTARKTLGIPSA